MGKRVVITLVIAALLGTLAVGSALAANEPVTPAQPTNFLGYCGMHLGRAAGGMIGFIADLLGMKPEEVIAERQAQKSLVQIAGEKGISEQELLDKVLESRKTRIDQLVKDGRITQEQADLAVKNMTERLKVNLNRTTVGPAGGPGGCPRWNGTAPDGSQQGFGRGFGRGMMGRGMMGGRGFGPGWTNPAPAPTAPATNS